MEPYEAVYEAVFAALDVGESEESVADAVEAAIYSWALKVQREGGAA